jgi:hypothetical protein
MYMRRCALQHKGTSWSAPALARGKSRCPCAGVVDIGASEVATRQGRDGWYEGVGDQARTAKEEGSRNRREGAGGKRMARAGTDIGCQCARRVVQSSLNLEPGAGVCWAGGRSQESAVMCMRTRWISNVRTFELST